MKLSKRCPKCGGNDLLSDVEVMDKTEGGPTQALELAAYGKPYAVLFRDKHTTAVRAWVCCGCGFVEMYAAAPANLKIPIKDERRA